MEHPVLYFVAEIGTDMTAYHIDGKAKEGVIGLRDRAVKRKATVVDAFDRENPPTHVIVSANKTQAVPERIAKHLGFACTEQAHEFMLKHNIQLVTRKWIDRRTRKSEPFLPKPKLQELYYGLSAGQQRPRVAHVSPSTSPAKRPVFRNLAIADLFQRISKSYKTAPLNKDEEWKQYTFDLLASKVKRLDFDITLDNLAQLRTKPGFGDSSVEIVADYLQNKSSQRLKELQEDAARQAMRAMMQIWGVGRVTARDLIQHYSTIEEVRRAVYIDKTLKLERNQLIGLDCYEDILEEITRVEVEQIFAIVKAFVLERLPSANVQLMGSYRRGKTTCGDVDILITHEHYPDTVPPKLLGKLVDDMRRENHMAHHLTFISGMNETEFETLPESYKEFMKDAKHYGRSAPKRLKSSSSTYMGVFHSPSVPGKRRRVDIKFYPYHSRVYAELYFTGNGFFNRSMRLWAKRKLNWHLDDHGLSLRDTATPVQETLPSGETRPFVPSCERDVFDKLGIAWKEPHERDGFDAVEGVQGDQLDQVSPRDLATV